ncbi:MAG: hypothetical protein ACE1ZQ_00155 [Ignavibacteriaceae bacterium]
MMKNPIWFIFSYTAEPRIAKSTTDPIIIGNVKWLIDLPLDKAQAI